MDNLSARWIKKESSKHPGKLYFFNKITGESSWDPPDGITLENIPSVKTHNVASLLKIRKHSGVNKCKTPAQDRLKRLRADLIQQQKTGIQISSKHLKDGASLVKKMKDITKEDCKTVIKSTSSGSNVTKGTSDRISASSPESSRNHDTRKTANNTELTIEPSSQVPKNRLVKRLRGAEGSGILSKVPRLAVEALCKIPKLVADNLSKFKGNTFERNTPVPTSVTKPAALGNCDVPSNKITEISTNDTLTATKLGGFQRTNPNCELQSVKGTKVQNIRKTTPLGLQASVRHTSVNERLQFLRKHLEAQRKLSEQEGNVCSTSTSNSAAKENSPMDWEEIEEQINEKITEIRQDNASDEGTLGEFYNVVSQNLLKISTEQSRDSYLNGNHFYFVVDTNVLLRNLSFIEDLRKLKIRDTDSSLIVIPYCVLQELDKIKTRSNQAVSTLAVRAIKYLNEKFERKDESIRGQSAIEAHHHLVEIENTDDNILNCCLQIKEKTNNILLLTNDVNLRNKAICNNILVSTKSDLESRDFNVT